MLAFWATIYFVFGAPLVGVQVWFGARALHVIAQKGPESPARTGRGDPPRPGADSDVIRLTMRPLQATSKRKQAFSRKIYG